MFEFVDPLTVNECGWFLLGIGLTVAITNLYRLSRLVAARRRYLRRRNHASQTT